MAFATTLNQTPTIIPDQPSWEKGVQLDITWRTTVIPSRNGTEQRISKLYEPSYRIRYTLAGYNRKQFAQRRAAMQRELRTLVSVPMWTKPYSCSVGGDGLLCSTGNVGDKFFKKDRFAVWMSADTVIIGFARVSYVNTANNSINVDLSTLIGTSYLTTAPTLLYPCVTGLRMDGAGQFNPANLTSTDEVVFVEDV